MRDRTVDLLQVADLLVSGQVQDICDAELRLSEALNGVESQELQALAARLQLLSGLSEQASALLRVRMEQSPLAVLSYGSTTIDTPVPSLTGIHG